MSKVRWVRHALLRFLQIPQAQRSLLLQALCWLPLSHWGVRAFGFKRGCQLMRRLAAWVGHDTPRGQPLVVISQSQQALNWAIHYGLHPGNCLSRALTFWWLLRRQGMHSDLRIGVRTSDGRFQAHAWLEYAGQPLNEAQNVRQQYVPFADELFDILAKAVI